MTEPQLPNAAGVDFGRRAADYARHRAGFPAALFERLAAFGIGGPGQQLVDLGTGTGTLARGFAERGARVTGIDPSQPMLDEAARLAADAGLQIEFRVATAEATGLDDASADSISAGQCWHWFDRERAAAEALRVLRPGGRIVIAHLDWLPLRGTVVEATEELIRRYNPIWPVGGNGFYPAWAEDVAEAGFTGIETFSFDFDPQYSHAGWRGRLQACGGVGSSGLGDDEIERFDRELAALLRERFPSEPLQTPHRVWALVARKPG